MRKIPFWSGELVFDLVCEASISTDTGFVRCFFSPNKENGG
jgi:hypothetical protein